MRWNQTCFLIGATFLSAAALAPAADKAAPSFAKDVLPLLTAKCQQCHGSDKQKAGLDLRTRASILQGGDNGPAVVPGSAKASLLWQKIDAGKMPPPEKGKLTAAEKELIKAWINAGASDGSAVVARNAAELTEQPVTEADRRFWSFQPPHRPAVPTVRHADRVRNPIDAFILAALEKNGLTLAPEADRLTLLRRATFDLTGLPPTPAEVEEFLNDSAPDAYERLIDRLLASGHYGERWGRHWLDLAGYADSEGILDADVVRTAAWRYRDYVIKAFNRDKPYDRFLQEQIAGDELVEYWKVYQTRQELSPEVVEGLIATGYLRCASDASRPDFVNIKNAPGYYYQTLDDALKIVTSSTLGLTVQCARCHSHKYDPIPQRDYYRLQAIFMSAYRPYQWVPQAQRRLLEMSAVQEQEIKGKSDAALAALNAKKEALRREFGGYLFTNRLGKLPPVIRDDVRVALNTEPAKRNEVQKYLAEKFGKELRPDPKMIDRILGTEFVTYKARLRTIEEALKEENARRASFAEIRALYDLPGEAKTPILRRGDYLHPGPEVPPGVLSALDTPQPFTWSAPPPDARTSGRRLAFARWLTQPEHPLTARVLVNRLWLHHFGEGIVATPDDFGHTGSPPSHPELLDWLATECARRGWSVKAMHRLMLLSSTYRQRSTVAPAALEAARLVDPDNRLLWRQRLRRLEAESLRDALLAASGTLNPDMFGPPVPMLRQPDGEVTTPPDASGRRRSIYLQVRRSQPLTFLQTFDQPVMETNCTRRGQSTVASQALAQLNSDFLEGQAVAFADRVLREHPADPAGYALLVAFGRPATEPERARLAAFLDTQTQAYGAAAAQQPDARRKALADLCHILLSANEFLYVD